MTKQEIERMIHDEKKRLNVGGKDFMKRHKEIMESCSALLKNGEVKEDVDDAYSKRT